MDSAGQVKLEELARGDRRVPPQRQEVIAHGSYFLQSQYYLAAQADEVYLDPFGFVLLDGYDRYRMFFKDALDKLDVDMHLFRAGKFKSAERALHAPRHVEPRTARRARLICRRCGTAIAAAIASARQLKPEAVVAVRQRLRQLGRPRRAATPPRWPRTAGWLPS